MAQARGKPVTYFVLKSLHILSVVIFIGNIVTGVFWKMHGDRLGTAASRSLPSRRSR